MVRQSDVRQLPRLIVRFFCRWPTRDHETFDWDRAVMTCTIPIRCHCGAPAIAISPGRAPAISEASDIMVDRGEPIAGRCLEHWPMLRGFQQELRFNV